MAIEKTGLLTIIDKNFGEDLTPYDLDKFTSLYGFFTQTYSVLKRDSIDDELKQKYITCLNELITNLNYAENVRIKKHYLDSLDASEVASYADELYQKYINRGFDDETLDEDEQKSGYIQDNKFNGYKEKVYIGSNLSGTLNEDGTVNYVATENVLIMNEDGTSEIYMNSDNTEEIDLKKYTLEKNGLYHRTFTDHDDFINCVGLLSSKIIDYVKTLVLNPNNSKKNVYSIEYSFSQAFLVDYTNKYESTNGTLLEMFEILLKSFTDGKNYFEEYLKRYFYRGLVERYRTSGLNDNTTTLKVNTYDPQNRFLAVPKVFERLDGKGGDINCLTTLGNDRTRSLTHNKVNKLYFEKSYFDCPSKILSLYISIEDLPRELADICYYTNLDYSESESSYLYTLANRMENKTQNLESQHMAYFSNPDETGQIGCMTTSTKSGIDAANYIKKYSDEIKQDFINSHLFPIRVTFTPWTDTEINKTFFLTAANILQQETGNIDFEFDSEHFILKLTFDDEDLGDFGNYFMGKGYCYYRRISQQLKDNVVSNPCSSSLITKDEDLVPNEFDSLIDDREIEIKHYSDVLLETTTEGGYTNAYLKNGTYIEAEFPDFKKTTLSRKNDKYLLEVTDFSKKNNLDTINQIRIMETVSNANRFLFKFKGYETETKTVYTYQLEFNTEEDINEQMISYMLNESAMLSENIVTAFSSYNKIIYFGNSETETVTAEKVDDENEIYSINIEQIETPEFFNGNITYAMGQELKIGKDVDAYTDNGTLYLNNIDGNKIVGVGEYSELKTYYYAVLEPGISNKDILKNGESMDVEIVDYIQTDGKAKPTVLRNYIYSEGTTETNGEYSYSSDQYEDIFTGQTYYQSMTVTTPELTLTMRSA